jgi:site-specific DNA recombinase
MPTDTLSRTDAFSDLLAAGLPMAGYLRISLDDTKRAKARARGSQLSKEQAVNKAIERQREDCLALLEDLGWTGTVEWYVDRDTSAYDENVTRTQFERMLSDLAEGRIAGVVAYHADRLARLHFDMERLLKIYRRQAKRAVLATAAYGRLIDPRSDEGSRTLRYEVDTANSQSAATSRRVARQRRQAAQEGTRVGGARPFGWADDKRTVLEAEAQVIREARERVLAGEGLGTIATDLSNRGIKTPRGSIMRRSTLVEILSNPALCGYRTHKGEIVNGKDGQPVVGDWNPILTVREWESVAALITPKWKRNSMSREDRVPGGPERKYLFTGVLRCAGKRKDGNPCGARMHGYRRSEGVYAYSCATQANGGCASVAIDGAKTDAFLTELVLSHLEANADAVSRASEPWSGAEELARREKEIREAREAYEAERVSLSVFLSVAEAQEKRVNALRRERAAWEAAQERTQVAPTSWRDKWDAGELSLTEKRQAVATVVRAVEVRPAVLGKRWTPDRLTPVFVQ